MTEVCRNMFSKLTTVVIFLQIINHSLQVNSLTYGVHMHSMDLKISGSSGILGWVAGDLQKSIYLCP